MDFAAGLTVGETRREGRREIGDWVEFVSDVCDVDVGVDVVGECLVANLPRTGKFCRRIQLVAEFLLKIEDKYLGTKLGVGLFDTNQSIH